MSTTNRDRARETQLRRELSDCYNVALTYRGASEEYRVNYIGGREATAYYTQDLQDAYDTGKAMAAHPSAPPRPENHWDAPIGVVAGRATLAPGQAPVPGPQQGRRVAARRTRRGGKGEL